MKMASIPINQNLTVAAILPAQHQQQTAPSDLQICQLQSIGSLTAADFKRIIHFRYVLLDFYNHLLLGQYSLKATFANLNATTSGFNKLESGSFPEIFILIGVFCSLWIHAIYLNA
jgi:hypothetical protein